ncbi:cell division protein FtsZ [Alterisphingorhabdus coralli]|uniref:Cell division protein FtsZ n=1 Tax=Alterisphingorhabdus coralli TaxID=3071408 RepID=A0AA97I2E6_9SPHN|nr:cell division protein FtsZ [Parasphingorhabdus sp. SCSIO 66989]WOE76158.1 cell division protein FtsZ [Parasphingorhabdus sp. SCSIO 66989]
MSIDIGPPAMDELRPRIAVIGVGGAGGNAIANMIAASVEGVDFIIANTDAQALNSSVAEQRIQLGPDITQGLGAGSRPEVGRAAAEETMAEIDKTLDGAHMCFIAAGMGGGTGTGAAPVIAKIARDKGILTVGVVTKPFTFEGSRRMRAAEAGIEELQKNVDTLIVIPNQNLFLIANADTTFKEAFTMADEVLQQGVRSITDLMVMPGLINLDFADVRSVMREMGKAMMGTGEAEGDGRALEAAEKAIANPLLDGVSMQGAKGVIISITGGDDMRLMEVDEAANHIRELVDADANIIWGSAFNDDLSGKIRVSVVATGIDSDGAVSEDNARPFSFARNAAPAAAPVQETPVVEEEAPAEEATAPEVEDSGAEAEQRMPLVTPTGGDSLTDTSSTPLNLRVAAEPAAESPVAAAAAPVEDAPIAENEAEDELLLDTESMEEQPEADEPPVLQPPEPANSDEIEPSKPAPRIANGGGTLFERMANLSRNERGEEDKDQPEDGGSLNIPRFLNRQNNQ